MMDLNRKIFVLLSLVCVTVYALPLEETEDVIEEDNSINPRGVTFFQVRVYQGYIILNENVEVDTIRNFVVVQAPPIGDYKAVTVFHDYNLNMTLAVYPASKRCYLFDRYSDIPEDISYWFSFRDSTRTTKAFDGKQMGRYKNHFYITTDFNVEKSFLTSKMREFCTDDMELRKATMMTKDELGPGSDEPLGDFTETHFVYMPYVPVPGERVKRRALASFAPHACTAGVR